MKFTTSRISHYFKSISHQSWRRFFYQICELVIELLSLALLYVILTARQEHSTFLAEMTSDIEANEPLQWLIWANFVFFGVYVLQEILPNRQ